MKTISLSLERILKEIGFEKSNELLYWLWYGGYISVYDHIEIIAKIFKEPPFDCTFKIAWINEYYFWMSDFFDVKDNKVILKEE